MLRPTTDGVGAKLSEELSSAMFEPGQCSGGNHPAPKAGGSCPCGMVTRIPAPGRPAAGPPPEVLALLAQCFDDGSASLDAATAGLLRERADRLLSALTTAGLVISAGAVDRLAA
ncbi:hypothetical protein SAMN04488546_1416 [Geodermatophilus poikilotrophus]|uniref:Uncharacterized protein n=2 Tax=Geodermatophilus poikilotrophus TaxID=1333667 RepID=A0A1I0BS55_9ACTN|nr:hypothetical protein SAMN04488546_1416 [Geodermatophilus poikilotrophus]